MVLDPSDYSIPAPGESYNPMQLKTYKKLIGFAFVATLLLYVWNLASNRGLPLLNALMGNVGLDSQGGDLEVFR